jgi:hypothetical protein
MRAVEGNGAAVLRAAMDDDVHAMAFSRP